MSTARQNLLPFDQLDDKQFESFLLQFLGAGISLEVTERLLLAENSTEAPATTARYRITRASLVGSKTQFGADVRVFTENGAEWIFQCKHYPDAPFSTSLAKHAVEKANREYPQASRYFLILAFPPVSPEVAHVVEADPKWQLWEPSEIWTRFQNEVPRAKQPDLVRRFFGDDTANRFYPLQQDSVLLFAGDFFARSLPINFGTTFVGREAELAQLLAFARASGPAAAILSAPGGIGKTRLLREFAERLTAESPDMRVLFLNPDASAQANTDALRAAQEGELVVVFDDAHRSETLRGDIARTVAEKKGHLLLSARPQSMEYLRRWLAEHGFVAAHQAEPVLLHPLTKAQLTELAAKTLDVALCSYAGPLAQLAQGNALIVTAAAKLLNARPPLEIATLLGSADFGCQVMDRLAEETLNGFGDESRRDLASDILQVLAVLAPWTEQVLPLNRIAAVLGCSVREFNRMLDGLLASGLVVRTGRGLRVVPDLLADHLVRRACFELGGERRITSLAEAIQKEFAPVISCATGLHVIRNLGEAEAQQGDADGVLVEPFWQEFKRQFEGAQLWMRAHLLQEWAFFAVAQPKRSLALARLAVATIDHPPSADGLCAEIVETPSSAHRNQVLAAAAGLLEPVAAHCPEQRLAAFDLLWDLDLQTGASVVLSPSSALHSLGHIANWESHQHLDAVGELLSWLVTRLRSAEGAERLLRRRSPVLSVLLKPVFECPYDWIESEPGSNAARLVVLSDSDTEPLYTAALNLIEQQVLPAGEVAILNALGILESALTASIHHGRESSAPEAVRRRALRTYATILQRNASPRIVFRIRETLRALLAHEPEGSFFTEAKAVLVAIPDTEDLQLATLLLSNAWTEYYHALPPASRPAARADNQHHTRWLQLGDSVASMLVARFPEAPGLFAELVRIGAEYSVAGEPADFAELFSALSRVSPVRAVAVAAVALSQPSTVFDRSLPALLPDEPSPASGIVGELAALVFASPNHERWSAFLRWLAWRGRAQVTPSLLARVADWSAHLDDKGLCAILPNVSLSAVALPGLAESIFANLPMARLSDSSIVEICQYLERQRLENDGLLLPAGFCARLITELQRLERLELRHGRTCLPLLAKEEPRRFFEMLRYRVRNRTGACGVLPFSARESIPLHGLCVEPDYPSLARELFGELRRADETTTSCWITLFQWAVLSVSPLGLQLLDEWLRESNEPGDLERLFRCLSFPRSKLVFEKPDFVRRILERVQVVAPSSAERQKLADKLGIWSGPCSRSYSGGELDPETRRYRDEAAKAAAIHAADSDLAAFYRRIVEQEDAYLAHFRREPEPQDEWSY
jgi:DNA-binding Lrp family transcriptional regulator